MSHEDRFGLIRPAGFGGESNLLARIVARIEIDWMEQIMNVPFSNQI
jgi:hypothetical protein